MFNPIEGRFSGVDGQSIFFRSLTPEVVRGVVIINHGYAEHSGRYVAVSHALASRGFAVFAEDHRGHGRTAIDLGFLPNYQMVLADLAVLHRRVQTSHPGKPVFFLGHSMGGLFTTRYLELWGDSITGAVINAPAILPPDDIPAVVQGLARVLGRVIPHLPMQPFYDPQKLCGVPAVWTEMDADPFVYKGKIIARTGAQLMRLQAETLAEMGRISCPILCTQGGDDLTIPPRASQTLIDGVSSSDKTRHVFEGLLHEVHNESTSDEVIAYWADWIEAHLPS